MEQSVTPKEKMKMETKFNFKSAICTSREQSERLLALGLKKETRDAVLKKYIHSDKYCYKPVFEDIEDRLIDCNDLYPAWSLHRLIEMMPEEMHGGLLCIFKDSIRYEEVIMDRLEAHFEVVGDNMYENAISCLEWLIEERYFPKEYLEE